MTITRIERHLFENKCHTVREVYRVFRDENAYLYREKRPSELTKKERETFRATGKTVYHF